MLKILQKSVDTILSESFGSFTKKFTNKIAYLYKKNTFKPYQIEKTIAGEKIQLIISDLFAKGWYDRPDHLDNWPELVWLKENSLKKGDIVVDCGANIGFTGLFFAKCVGEQGQVLGFEALPANADIARKNIDLNQVNNFEIRNQAVGSYHGTVEFNNYPNGSVGKTDGSKTINVPVVKLDEVFVGKKPTFLKIDVEGYEIEVLKGATEILKTKPKLEIEIHCSCFSDRLSSVKELLGLLPLSEYKIFLQLVSFEEILPYVLTDVTPELLAKYDNVHLFALPK
ncbi:FkbM family methyltransferase [Anabaena sp. UHCC 0253]|uniref:FkbM family methyltransferase n=1 Tax=Anabaena sp. UHCC 0253 TaxID=2590019 RepID=UPI00144805CB|nr:FkbM family methyltransferase [Anabaena sp. UHCC 0253]